MLTKNKLFLASIVCLGVFHASPSFALVNWYTSAATCSGSYVGNSCTVDADGTGPTYTATAWANTDDGSANNELGEARLNVYGGGFGATHADSESTDSPQHALDNEGRFEMILFDFGNEQISLEQVDIGWKYDDADISVLAYTGTDPFNLDNYNVDGTNENLTGTGGWDVVGNYDADSFSGMTAIVQGHDADGDGFDSNGDAVVSSSYWLIGAYNPVFNPSGTDCVPTPSSQYCNGPLEYADHMKIAQLAGSIIDTPPPPPPPPTSVPEPGTLLLLASAMLITPRVRRMKKAA